MARISKPWRLLHIHSLLQHTMKESVADVNLAKMPITRGGEGEHQPYSLRFNHRTEGVEVVDTVLLRKTASNQARLVLVDGAVGVLLQFIHPFAADNILAGRARDKSPCSVAM
jgi:hypothetical protein